MPSIAAKIYSLLTVFFHAMLINATFGDSVAWKPHLSSFWERKAHGPL